MSDLTVFTSRTDRYVALKVGMARYSNSKSMEAAFSPDPSLKDHPGKKNLCTKIDSFMFQGPNGSHLCLVFEPLGRSFEEVLDNADRACRDPTYKPPKYDPKQWSVKLARRACEQVVLGLDYLHAQRIMHRDIQPGNILLALAYDLHALKKDKIQQDVWDDEGVEGDQDSMDEAAWAEMNYRRQLDYINIIERNDGEPLTEHDPKYTVAGISLLDKVDLGSDPPPSDFCVQLTDLGNACRFEDCNDGTTPYPLDIRAPEVVLRLAYSEKADIWALACTLFRIVTLQPLIPLWMTSDKDATDDENVKNFVDRLGKLPDWLRSAWTRADQHLDDKGNLLEPDPYQEDNAQFGDLWQGVRLGKPKDMSDTESKVFHDLLLKMLDYDPSKRLSTTEVLQHPWFHTERYGT